MQCQAKFLSTLSLRRATIIDVIVGVFVGGISIHALLAESDRVTGNVAFYWGISIHALLAESDRAQTQLMLLIKYFYPRSPCGERLLGSVDYLNLQAISIHALLAESDRPQYSFDQHFAISIHALLAESDLCHHINKNAVIDFYPRSPCGERLKRTSGQLAKIVISIHALLAESDDQTQYTIAGQVEISIHALLAESDDNKPTQRAG